MADTMVAAVVRNAPRRISIERVAIPVPGSGQVLVNVKANGLCGSDVHGFMDENSKGRVEGLIMGHECAGVVAACGEGASRFQTGDRVVVNPQITCGECYCCQNGYPNVCESVKVLGSALRGFIQGAMAEYVVVPQKNLYALPQNLSFEEGAMTEPVANAVHALNRAGINLGDNVVIMGAGTIGLCMVKAAKLSGAAQVIAVDISPFHLDLAKEFGADVLVNSSQTDPVEEVRRLCGGIGADVTVEAVGLGPTYAQAALMTRKRGTLVFFGAAAPRAEIELYPLLHRELNMVGCTGFDVETTIALDLMASGQVDVKRLISHRFPIEETGKAIETFLDPSNHVIKAMIVND